MEKKKECPTNLNDICGEKKKRMSYLVTQKYCITQLFIKLKRS